MSATAHTLHPPSRTLMFLEGRAIHELGELARIEAAQAPAHQADVASVMLEEPVDDGQHVLLDAVAQAQVAPQLPTIGAVAVRIEKAA